MAEGLAFEFRARSCALSLKSTESVEKLEKFLINFLVPTWFDHAAGQVPACHSLH
jgi:hypothetical protein